MTSISLAPFLDLGGPGEANQDKTRKAHDPGCPRIVQYQEQPQQKNESQGKQADVLGLEPMELDWPVDIPMDPVY